MLGKIDETKIFVQSLVRITGETGESRRGSWGIKNGGGQDIHGHGQQVVGKWISALEFE